MIIPAAPQPRPSACAWKGEVWEKGAEFIQRGTLGSLGTQEILISNLLISAVQTLKKEGSRVSRVRAGSSAGTRRADVLVLHDIMTCWLSHKSDAFIKHEQRIKKKIVTDSLVLFDVSPQQTNQEVTTKSYD